MKKKFNDYLHRYHFQQGIQLQNVFQDLCLILIEEYLRNLNNSLREIDFKSTPVLYIQLATTARSKRGYKGVQEDAGVCCAQCKKRWTRTVDGRRNHFYNHIEPLIAKLDVYEWRKSDGCARVARVQSGGVLQGNRG
jgi:uncharacterized protein YPO0396